MSVMIKGDASRGLGDNMDWKRNNKIGLRNFTEATDFHDLVKTQLVRMLRREHPDSHNVPIYTEFSPDKPNKEYPDIWMKIKKDIIVYELQETVTKKWTEEMAEKYEDCDLMEVPLKEISKQWKDAIHSKKNNEQTDPIKLLRNILEVYVV